ncbi:hypothetical protein BN7_3690 [Wickerhamomyces ciferrii]|uniref:Ribosome maturation protein SDO1/SBDS N-terminal domain-containing protein n=1 Tax=Wickerhamomyces ciferrii (strain ATCC 14091 / BCRC 22168 / CBS 111 / JCM 3599 / NBRC 0793 / NRRL Y-1031 F-60-10) TaxID=1206466 RepID=K0KPP3_WICCF|nr:uncharacterized protein BN7_3690 [Wickerhamomyces ciferrii]CCH44132.1 hypothetical protein BN7_3690 [Wickerhamomyces ciferrii]
MSNPVKVFYKGDSQDFVVFVESEEIASKYTEDSTIPLVDVVGTFKVYSPESGRGVEGVLHEASNRDLENQFGKKPVEDVIKFIIHEGTFKNNTKVGKKQWGSTNDSNGINH